MCHDECANGGLGEERNAYLIVITVSFCGSRTSGRELAPVHSLKMSTTKMAGMAPQGNGNGQSNLSSPASSRRLPMLRAETVSLASLGVLYLIIVIIDNFELAKKIEEEFRSLSPQAGANGRGGNNDATYASGSLSSGDLNAPAKADFMISFLVDARGGTMHGTRFSGVTVSVFPHLISIQFPFAFQPAGNLSTRAGMFA